MEIRNNLLRELKEKYIRILTDQYGKNEADSLISILIEELFGYNNIDVSLNPELRLSESEILRIHQAFKKLKGNKPVQYITGYSDFMDLKLKVSPDVLIPRQETEELVDFIRKNEQLSGMRVLDIGTGSGCIAIGLFKYLENPIVHAIDIDKNALEIARENAINMEAEIVFKEWDILSNVASVSDYPFDIIVSNPPYVTESEKQKMKKNVLDYEPSLALFVPDNEPLKFYRAIFEFTKNNLKGNGRIYLEINESFGNEMKDLMANYGYRNINLYQDLHKKTRFISAVKPV